MRTVPLPRGPALVVFLASSLGSCAPPSTHPRNAGAHSQLAPAPAPAPIAPIRPVRDTYLGVSYEDPYRWMEQPSPELDAHLHAEAAHARRVLDASPRRDELMERLRDLATMDVAVFAIAVRDGRRFFMQRWPSEENARFFVQEGNAAPRLLVDADALGEGHQRFDWYEPSPSGEKVAFGVSLAGTEETVLHVLDVPTGKLHEDAIDRARFARVSWLDEARFAYSRRNVLAPGAPPSTKNQRVRAYVHALGHDPATDRAVLGFGLGNETFDDADIASVWSPPHSAFVVGAQTRGVADASTYYVASRAELDKTPVPWRRFADAEADLVTQLAAHGEDLYLLTHKNAPRSKILRTTLKRPDLSAASVALPEGGAVLESVRAARDALYVGALDGGASTILRVPYGASHEREVRPLDLPFTGTTGRLVTHEGADGLLFSLESWTVPPRIFSYGEKAGIVDTKMLDPAPDAVAEASKVEVTSADGTRVPLSIVRPRGPMPKGARLVLRGYGAYGISEVPVYRRAWDAWIERGGVIATCHTRGGGELGEAWHQAGKLEKKQNGIDDYVACARYLEDQGITTPERLAAEGGSAAGILLGGALTQHPELFGAAIIANGVMNVARFGVTPAGPVNAPEFGDPKTDAGLRALVLGDAYLHVKDGARYPAVLLTTGARDARVVPWQPAKMAARLRAATSSGRPVLLRVDFEGGHGMGETASAYQALLADEWAFLFAQLR